MSPSSPNFTLSRVGAAGSTTSRAGDIAGGVTASFTTAVAAFTVAVAGRFAAGSRSAAHGFDDAARFAPPPPPPPPLRRRTSHRSSALSEIHESSPSSYLIRTWCVHVSPRPSSVRVLTTAPSNWRPGPHVTRTRSRSRSSFTATTGAGASSVASAAAPPPAAAAVQPTAGGSMAHSVPVKLSAGSHVFAASE